MALSILDGNQSATTLSTIVSSGQHITAHTVVSLGTQAITDMRSAVSGSVVSIPLLPAISGTVTANAGNGFTTAVENGLSDFISNEGVVPISGTVTAGGRWYDGENYQPTPFLVSEEGALYTVTDLVQPIPAGTNRIGVVTIGGGTVTIGAGTAQIGSVTASISGTVPISISSVTVGNSVTIGSLPALAAGTAQIGSVTASISSNPSGALTTRFGSVTTANTAQITTAVTNTSRKYLFSQNISTGIVTIGVGFSPTTTQGIQLSPGSGIVFDSFCPTGAVYWLGATTGAAWSILEG
jgi:hypothetical protein